ncbi:MULTISPECIES: glycerophosphodiester phosphodiesterase family protein [unclassified Novosphingobium]|uniref:glycerophosphodiester phosphodiesterase family protein n=1 Tax=unclassified Novosphingobium TaxID=2644732 RepID=UPI00086C473A|nr:MULTISPECIES: glycerophosphodiester phosphodiesterase family protein [unclassified Novosphingobium]MBN9145922.1 glycerophosphodiester phosphodiesterase [Novosphingobium sp.]MDR6709984.1 glycerophosphoryl diester phosphodiesterase [Novosphingobium sp. 1748]ODU80494.1 MAG: hypothetical protein ABT10_17610 [Novosphingobium sp. SCN 63-17]OJX95856.1 MAG: hypothetical protein BGP00_16230 [Novosphingobium sp. 63-713]
MTERADWLRGAVIAHRGLHDMARSGGQWIGHWAENTLSAFTCAIAAGYGIECDVRLAGDGTVVVFHDAVLDRLTHARGPVKDHGMEVLSRLPVGGTRDVIPSLVQMLDLVGGRVPLLIEIKVEKREDPAALCEGVARALADYVGPVAIMSFDHRAPRWFAQNAPDVVRGMVLESRDMSGWRAKWLMPRRFSAAEIEFLAVDIRGLPHDTVARWRETWPIATWTVRRAIQREVALEHADALIAEGDGLA